MQSCNVSDIKFYTLSFAVYIVGFIYSRDGTTDVTRTMHFGNPTNYERV